MPAAPKPLREIHHIGDDTPERLVTSGTCGALHRNRLHSVGVSDIGRGYRMARPDPAHAHLLVTLDGEGQILLNGEWQPCPSGHAYLSPPHRPMAFQPHKTGRWRIAWVYFEADTDPPPIVGEGSRRVETDGLPLSWAIEGLHREVTNDATPALVDQWADLVTSYAQRLVSPAAPVDPLWRLWAEVEAHLAQPWTLERLSKRSGYEPETLRRLAKTHVGDSPMRHVTHLRMRRAAALLRTTPGKLHAVAAAVGYRNVFAFSVAFKRHLGVAPSAYRG